MGKRAGATVIELKGSHLVFMPDPKSVADVTEMAAKGLTRCCQDYFLEGLTKKVFEGFENRVNENTLHQLSE